MLNLKSCFCLGGETTRRTSRGENFNIRVLSSIKQARIIELIIFFQREHRLQQEMILANQWSTKDDLLPNQPRKVCHRGVFW